MTPTKTSSGKYSVADSMCCGYGADGKGSGFGVDCLMIPGAVKGSSPYTKQAAISQCGAAGGLVYSKGTYKSGATTTGHKTVCSSSVPFRIAFSQMPLNIVLQLMELTVMDSNYRIS